MRRLHSITLLFLVLVASSARAQELSLAALMASGDAAFGVLDNEAAVRHYEAARSASNGEIPFELLARLSRVYTDHSTDLVAAGERKRAEQAMNRALEYARQLEEGHPERPETWFLLAIAHGNLAEFAGGRGKVRIGRAVEQYCLRAIDVDPEYAPGYLVLGVFYREVAEVSWLQRLFANALFGGLPHGSYERSAEMLRKAVELDPSLPLAQFELGRTLYRSDQMEEARPFLQAGIDLEPMSTVDVRNAIDARTMLASIEDRSDAR